MSLRHCHYASHAIYATPMPYDDLRHFAADMPHAFYFCFHLMPFISPYAVKDIVVTNIFYHFSLALRLMFRLPISVFCCFAAAFEFFMHCIALIFHIVRLLLYFIFEDTAFSCLHKQQRHQMSPLLIEVLFRHFHAIYAFAC